MNCPECKAKIEEEDFDLDIGNPMPQMISVVAGCTRCPWIGTAVVPIEGFLTHEDLIDPETAA